MAPQPQNLPTRFPCWCRAVYSWGGESKRDLGFVEGDLIECLNAGDGSWWMGRLRRDKRMMGFFPSNFVQVLDDSFRPASRASSPLPDRAASPNPFNPQPKENKPKPFRKPFQAYAAPDAAAAKRAELAKQESLLKSRTSSPLSSRTPRTSSPRIVNPGVHNRPSRAPSTPQQHDHGPRAPSPAPSFEYRSHSRGPEKGPSPVPFFNADIGSSPPPPPPPAHRYVHSQPTSIATYDDLRNEYHTPSRAPSPHPPSPGPTGMTPSPLRNAMDDVMSSLQDMGTSQPREPEPTGEPLDPWSPEAFDQTYTSSARRGGPPRPQTSLGIVDDHDYDYAQGESEPFNGGHLRYPSDQQPPQLSNYVERMESRLGHTNRRSTHTPGTPSLSRNPSTDDRPPPPPPKMYRPGTSVDESVSTEHKLRHRKSAFEVGREMLGRTFTTKSSATNSSSGVRSDTTTVSASTQATDRSIMSGYSAGGFSATSAGSLARKKEAELLQGRSKSAFGHRQDNFDSRPQTPLTGVSFHSSHATGRQRSQSQVGWHGNTPDVGMLGGLTAPKPKKSGFFKKIIESAKTGAASARSSIVVADSPRPSTAMSKKMPDGVTAIAGGFGNSYNSKAGKSGAGDMGMGGSGVDWVQVRRDINRSNTLSRIERIERKERCQMMDYPAISPVEELYQAAEGDEGADGRPVREPMNFQTVNLSLVDKNARFINSLPPMTNPMSLATGYVCRPYRNDVQRLRAIFTWVSEKIAWEGDFEGQIDTRRVIQAKRACAEEIAVLVMEMCSAVGIHCEVVQGFLKAPGETLDLGVMPRSNHFWNAVVVDNEWRIMDCSLASPTNPRRALYSSTGALLAESWWFLARPLEICWTHVSSTLEDQHIFPSVAPDILLSLPCACPPFFKNGLEMDDYDTSLLRIDDLELVQIKVTVPADTEVVAEVEAREFTRDYDGDCFESGEIIKKRALAQAEWFNGQKRYTIKALLPGDEGQGILKVYAGKRGLMHSIKDIPHPLAFALPIIHNGDNPPYDFVTRHPTPHAQRHDLYVAQPQCQSLAVNNTFVFAIRQHPSSLAASTPDESGRAPSPNPFARPSSAMSMAASSVSGSAPSTYSGGPNGTYSVKKPAKLAIQAPGGKILRLMRKEERSLGYKQGPSGGMAGADGDGGTWETIIKIGEKGTWRGLVLADRSARWCVFAEWNCI